MIEVLLADDQPLARAGLRALIDTEPDMTVVGEAADGEEAVQLTRRLRPDIVIMDIRMPGMDGIQATQRISADPALSSTRTILLTTFENDEYIVSGLRSGARGFLMKDVRPADLLEAIRVVAAGYAMLAPSVTSRLIDEVLESGRPVRIPELDRLTEREREVLILVARGLSNEEIGRELRCSPATAKTHVSRVAAKLGARDRVHLVILAYESGLVKSGDRTRPGRAALTR